MKHHTRHWTRVGLVLLFLLAFGLRATAPLSRQLEWYHRSINFITAVLEGRWSDTVFSEHPGVTTMWIVGGAQQIAYDARLALGQHPPSPGSVEGRAFIAEMSIGVCALATCIALAVVGTWYPLKRLFGVRVAWAAVLLLALDPYHIANSKVLHLDTLLTEFMTLSALTLLVYLQDTDWRAFVASAVLGGLALLTKAPSLFLVPFSALAMLVTYVSRRQLSVQSLLRHLALPMLLWLVIVVAVFILLYPAMWTVPEKALELTIRQTVHDTQTPHFNPVYFHGKAYTDDPGAWYYVYTLAFKSSWVSLSLALLGVLTLWRLPVQKRRPALLIIVYAVCFGLQMTIGAKKGLRYLLPLFPMFDTLAALGWAAWRQGIGLWFKRPGIIRIISALPILVLAVTGLTVYPYYGTHYNWLWGGIQAATHEFALQEQGEGVDLAARWLDTRGGKDLQVAVQLPGVFTQYTDAQIVAFDAQEIDYLVFDRNHLVRNYRTFEWKSAWKCYRSREPAFQVDFQDVPYVWVYRALPTVLDENTPDHTHGGRLGDTIELVGYDWQADWVATDTSLPLHLYWRAATQPTVDYTVFVHLHGPDGQLTAQCDSPPLGGARPTTTWQPGEMIRDICEVVLPANAPTGEYKVFAGMYNWPELKRLPAYAPDSTHLPDGRLQLTSFELAPSRLPWARMVPTWGAALIVLGVGAVSTWQQKEEHGG